MGEASRINTLQALLESCGVLLLDGAMGTELERSGFKTSLPLWSAPAVYEAPELIEKIHIDYIKSGARIVTANTFRTGRYTLAKVGKARDAKDCTTRAIQIARTAVSKSGQDILVAGSIAPLEDCYEPDLVPDDAVIEKEYSDQIEHQSAAGVDLVLVETMINEREAIIAARLLNQAQMPFVMSFTANEKGKLLDGTPLPYMLNVIHDFSPFALMLNCREPQVITKNLAILNANCHCPFGAYANGSGQAGGATGWVWDRQLEDSSYLSNMVKWLDMGARLVGGCCGTTPDTLKKMSKVLADRA